MQHASRPDMIAAKCPQLTAEEWQCVREFEAVLNQTKCMSTLVQYEKKFVGAYVPLVQRKLWLALTSDKRECERLQLPALPFRTCLV